MAMSQWFQSEPYISAAEISAISFNKSGNFLAFGDSKGNVNILSNIGIETDFQYELCNNFISHKVHFDYLTSIEIDEKINKIEWLQRISPDHCLLTTNDKLIKLWKMHYGFDYKGNFTTQMFCSHVYQDYHSLHINSLSANCDQETFLSADELRINIWNFQHSDQPFNIVDVKPDNMAKLTEIITTVKFNPHACYGIVYGLSSGLVRLVDMRESAFCTHYSVELGKINKFDQGKFSNIYNFISDVNFSHSGIIIMARDYLRLNVWDIRMYTVPLRIFVINDHVPFMIEDLHDENLTGDRFDCSFSPDDKFLLTGSYDNLFRIFSISTGESLTLKINDELKGNSTLPMLPYERRTYVLDLDRTNIVSSYNKDVNKRLLHLSWHPSANVLSMASNANLCFLQDKSFSRASSPDNSFEFFSDEEDSFERMSQ